MIKRLGSNIYIGNRRKLDRMFNALISRITWVGTPALPATSTATGARDSAMVGGSGRGVNEVDSLTIGGIPMLGCLASDADAPTDLGVGYGVDLVTCTPTYAVAGTIIQAAMPYGYSGGANPVSSNAKFFLASNFDAFTPGNSRLRDTDGSPTLTMGGSVTDATLDVFMGAWDNVNYYAQWNSDSRINAVQAEI